MYDVPHLRFPEFSEEWEKCSIQDYGEVVTGNTPPTSHAEYYENGSYLWASPADLGINKNIIYTKNKLSLSGFKKTRNIPKGSVLVTCIGSTIGKMGMATETMSSNQQINSIVVNDKSNSDFVYYAICRAFPRYLSEVGVQAVPILSKSNFEKLPNYTTCRDEQDKIGYFLNLLDERIATQNKIIEDLKELKSAISKSIFSLMEDGKSMLLGDVAHISNGCGDVQDADPIKREGWYPFFDRSEEQKWFPTYSIDKEAIIYAGEGQSFYPRYYKGKFALHQRCYAITDFSEILSPKYCYYFMGTLNSYFIRNAVGSTVPSLRIDMFQKVKLRIPSIKRQKDIVSMFDMLNMKCENETSIMALFKEQKFHLLQQMFI